jgi:hypothetical protein
VRFADNRSPWLEIVGLAKTVKYLIIDRDVVARRDDES